jgi:hypothetical protein
MPAELTLPTGVRTLVVPDRQIREALVGIEADERTLDGGAEVFVISVPAGATLVMDGDDPEDFRIRLSEPEPFEDPLRNGGQDGHDRSPEPREVGDLPALRGEAPASPREIPGGGGR